MPYRSIVELPESVQDVLPDHAQHIYREAFNSALKTYKDPKKRRKGGDREEAAHRVAWAAVKHKYAKGSDDKWHPKS